MYLSDLHLHSKYSPDGSVEVRDIVLAALDQGMNEICLTDHLDIFANEIPDGNFSTTGLGEYRFTWGRTMDMDALKQDVEDVKKEFGDRLIIRLGIELGQPMDNPEVALRLILKLDPDFIIGSIHTMPVDQDLYFFDFSKMDVEAFFHDYLKRETELAEHYDYDVIGHWTYPLRYLTERGFPLDLKDYMDEIRNLFRIVIQRGKGIEFNVAGICRNVRVLLPDIFLIKEYLALGGEILTIGSDAHVKEHVGAPVSEGMQLLKEAGVKRIASFHKRKPVFHEVS